MTSGRVGHFLRVFFVAVVIVFAVSFLASNAINLLGHKPLLTLRPAVDSLVGFMTFFLLLARRKRNRKTAPASPVLR